MGTIPHCRNLSAVGLALLLTALPARAEILESNLKEWKNQYDKEAQDIVEKQLAAGKTAIVAEHQPKIELAAKYYTAQIKFFKPDKGSEIQAWFTKIEKLFELGKGGEFQQAYLKIFAAESAKQAVDILDSPFPNAALQNQINVLRYMAILGDYGQEAVLPVLVRGLGLKNEGARYYAAKGLHGFFAQVHRPDKPIVVSDKKLEAEAIGKLVEQLNNPDRVTDDAPDERLDGFRMLRREVIRALAQTRTPQVKTENGDALVALELGRVVYGTKEISPPPRYDERVEAAMGLALMDPAGSENYQPDYAAACIGAFVADYALRYRESKPSIPTVVASMEDYAIKLAEVLVKLRDSKQVSDYQKKVATMCVDVLANIGGAKGNPANLKIFIEDPSKPANAFFKDVKDSSLPDTLLPIKVQGEKFTAAPEK